MTPTPHWCPVDDCDFGEHDDKTLQQVRSHINSMGGFDGAHSWEDLKAEVEAQATSSDQQADQPTEGGKSAGSRSSSERDQQEPAGDQRETSETTENDQPKGGGDLAGSPSAGGDDQQEPAGDQRETSENSDSDQPEDRGESAGRTNADQDTTEMATQEEYEEQYSDGDNDEETDLPDTGGAGESADQPADGDDGDQDGLGFSVPSVSASTVVLVAGVALAAYLVWRLYSGGSDAVDQYDAPEEQADEADQSAGGMVDIEAGTGGVEV